MHRTITTLHEYRTLYPENAPIPTLTQSGLHLPRFDDVTPALRSLRGAFRLFAFSNGKRSEVDAVLSNANILDYFEGIVRANDVRSFKPDPAGYSYARRATRACSSPFWLVSSNPLDVIGARSAGLSSAWAQRSEEKIYDPWGVEPKRDSAIID